MKKLIYKTQQKIYVIYQILKSYASKLCISSFVVFYLISLKQILDLFV